jgi:hypothetical protein
VRAVEIRPALRLYLHARRALQAIVPSLVVALPPLYWVYEGTKRAALTTLGRDQGIFQYVAWAITQGQRAYLDVRDVNGPLTPFIHLVFQWLGGADEHRFRVLDLLVTGAVYALVGACLPGLVGNRPKGTRGVARRVGWALAAWVVLSGQYLLYIFWDTAQRESFFNWFMLSSTALQLAGQGAWRQPGSERRSRALLIAAGALSLIPWFGKPTYAAFTLIQVVALLYDDVPKLARRRRLAPFAIGAAIGIATQIAFLLRYGDIASFVRISLAEVPSVYRFIWPRTLSEIFSVETFATLAAHALVTSVLMLTLLVYRELPRRVLPIVLMPIAGLASVIAQAKGFPYHFHPVSAGLAVQWVTLVVWLWERVRLRTAHGSLIRLVPAAAGAALAAKVAFAMPQSHYVQSVWLYTKARDAEERSSHDYLVYFQTSDFFPWELRQAARYLERNTKPTDRVQTYGMDPYLLFLSKRLSATPYIYAYDLNADTALTGGAMPPPLGRHPDAQQVATIRALRDAHERDLLSRLERVRPAAFVFHDKSPLITWPDSVKDFDEHNALAGPWVHANYRQVAEFGAIQIWMRNDLAAEADAPSAHQAGERPADGATN